VAETRGSGKWVQLGVPHKGWTCTGVEDLEEPSMVCEMCETQEIRYVHYMEHPDYPDVLGVGCICAGYMEADYEGARQREQSLKSNGRRRGKWLERSWRRSAAGNEYLNVSGYNVVIYKRAHGTVGPAWGFTITNRATAARASSRKPYDTSDGAKLAAFDGMNWLKGKGR